MCGLQERKKSRGVFAIRQKLTKSECVRGSGDLHLSPCLREKGHLSMMCEGSHVMEPHGHHKVSGGSDGWKCSA